MERKEGLERMGVGEEERLRREGELGRWEWREIEAKELER